MSEKELIAALQAYTAERALAAARNEAHAVPPEFPVQWDVGAPLPHPFIVETGHGAISDALATVCRRLML